MRKALSILLTLGVLVAATAAPALAKKKEGHFVATGLPFPMTGTVNEGRGCLDGLEGVHWTSASFKAPAKGNLAVEMKDFQGDWDLHVTDADGNLLASSTTDNIQTPPTEQISISLGVKEEVVIVACNWSGGPQSHVYFTFTY